MSKVYTVTEAAYILKRTKTYTEECFLRGRLGGWRVIGTQDIRIPYHHLLRFMKEGGYDLSTLEDTTNDIGRAETTSGARDQVDSGSQSDGPVP